MLGRRLLRWVVFLIVAAPAAAHAQTGWTRKSANLRAGPDQSYPLVARIPADAEVVINGCVDGWSWCDVTVGPDRGWIWAGNLESEYQNRRVLILENGPVFGYPIVTYSVGPYWDTYYRGRPWYGRRTYWIGHPVPLRPGYVRPGYVRPGYVHPAHPGRAVVVHPAPRPPRPVAVHPAPRPARPPAPAPARPRPAAPRPAERPRHDHH
jgi:uncharacterized protein YraI